MTITLYDIPSTVPGIAWSPNTWKTRMALNYKGISYKTEWVEYPDIAPLCKNIGAAPTFKRKDGSDYYSLPVIHDPSTGKVISDSLAIAEYLDSTYPDTPKLFPDGMSAAIAMFRLYLLRDFDAPDGILTCAYSKLNPRSQEYFRRTREASYKCTLEDFALPSSRPEREKAWAMAGEALSNLAKMLDKNGEGKVFFLGDTFSYADIILVSEFLWIKKVMEPEDWEIVSSWDGGRWKRLFEMTEKYQATD